MNDDFQRRQLRLNGAMFWFAARHEPALWAEFQQAITNLDHWIDEQNPKLNTASEREVVTQAILMAQGNQAQAARWLGLSRLTLREKLKQLGLYPGK